MAAGNPTPGYAATGCGCLLSLVTAATALFGAFHVVLDPGGAISADEAMPALLGGACCTFPSLAVIGAGVFLVMRAKKATPPPAEK
jgi:hypothetical protein